MRQDTSPKTYHFDPLCIIVTKLLPRHRGSARSGRCNEMQCFARFLWVAQRNILPKLTFYFKMLLDACRPQKMTFYRFESGGSRSVAGTRCSGVGCYRPRVVGRRQQPPRALVTQGNSVKRSTPTDPRAQHAAEPRTHGSAASSVGSFALRAGCNRVVR
jgi:hypothetical protein